MIPTSIQTESKLQAVLGNDNKGQEQDASTSKKGGRYYELPENIAIEDCSIFFIGEESLTLTNIMMIHNKCPVCLY